ncbi:MAG: 50S ribosomal protein L6 [Deltaproteobacteria bacterium]|nr:50S ribosomal protein L6 [Deltaproteobacteria bacterium]MBI3391062.1 50S ribosomal protein L6 [Deltaproteobacteria bacterium]
MSRIGRLAIPVPSGVQVNVTGADVKVEGPKGKLSHTLPAGIALAHDGATLRVTREGDGRNARSLHGLTRKLVANMVTGVSTGFTRSLEIVGVGYRAEVKGNAIQLSLGFSHPIVYQLPQGVQAKIEKQTLITLESSDRRVLGEVAAGLRGLRPPEPYKGKGVKYAGEKIRRKAGKAAGAAGA